MRLLVFDRQDRTARVMAPRQLAALASGAAVERALARLRRGVMATIPGPKDRIRGWKIVAVLNGGAP